MKILGILIAIVCFLLIFGHFFYSTKVSKTFGFSSNKKVNLLLILVATVLVFFIVVLKENSWIFMLFVCGAYLFFVHDYTNWNFVILRWFHLLESIVANIFFMFPSRKIKFVWVTWTDGKTTTNELIYHILKNAGKKVGIVSTVSIDNGAKRVTNESKMTTPDPFSLNKIFAQMRWNKLEYAVVEPSSHAIYQFRYWPAKFVAVGITNLSHEHLNFHKTMTKYFQAKAWLFRHYLTKWSIWVMPFDFEYGKELEKISKTSKMLKFSKDKKTDLYATNLKQNPEIECNLHIDWANAYIKTNLIWEFNIENILIAAWICKHIWLSLKDITKGINTFQPLPWRQEIVKSKNDLTFIVDFALTPNSLTHLYESIKKLNFKRQIAILWSCGGRNRDKVKRSIMWSIAWEKNDLVILTEEENYEEDWMEIIKWVEKWLVNSWLKNYKIIKDRKDAINYCIQNWQPWDVIIITWMGSFNTRKMWEQDIPWNDKNVILELLWENITPPAPL